MKKLFFIISSILLTLASNAETKLSIGNDQMLGKNHQRVLYQFDPLVSNNTKQINVDGLFYLQNNHPTPNLKIAAAAATLRLDSIVNKNAAANSYKDVYTYDANKNISSDIGYSWTNSQWLASYKTINTFDVNGNQVLSISYAWDATNNVWLSKSKSESTFDAFGNNILGLNYSWNSNSSLWLLAGKSENTYDSNKNCTYQGWYTWNSTTSQWAGTYTFERTFDSHNNLILQKENMMYNNQWSLFIDKYDITYDNNGYRLVTTDYAWGSNPDHWILIAKTENTNDTNGNVTREINYSYNNSTSVWTIGNKYEFSYDYLHVAGNIMAGNLLGWVKNPLLSMTGFNYDGTNWTSAYSSTYYYTDISTPTITSFSPGTAASGSSITISGTNFSDATEVSFGGTPASSFSVLNSTTISAVVAAGASGKITVSTPKATASSSSDFTYIAHSGVINYNITFTGSGASSSVGDVLVQNLTQGTSIIVPAGNILNLYDVSSDINQLNSDKEGIVIYPNTVQGNNTLSFQSKQTGATQLNVYGIDGRKVLGANQQLQQGENTFQLALQKGAYVLQVVGKGYAYSAKMINQVNAQSDAAIRYLGNENISSGSLQKIKSSPGISYLLYNALDQLLYKAVSGVYSSIVTDVPSASKITDFYFVACQDADGNNYTTVNIGTQTWMAENLKTTKYKNGEVIPNVNSTLPWRSLNSGGWCDYNNNIANANKYGHLYNWYSVSDSRNIAPAGWHVASMDEWTTLTDYVTLHTGTSKTMTKAIAANTDWLTSGYVGSTLSLNNSTGFSGLPAGNIGDVYMGIYDFGGMNIGSWWWSTDANYTDRASGKYIDNGSLDVYGFTALDKRFGLSVRCVKNIITLPTITTNAISGILNSSATCTITLTGSGGDVITAMGICWSTSPAPTIANNTALIGQGSDPDLLYMYGLNLGTKYYVRAFATNSKGTAYGNEQSFSTVSQITDADGNVYHSVTIGTQTWLVENLKTTHYQNAEPIANVKEFKAWFALTTGAWCDNMNDPANGAKYGKLYNYYAVTDSRKIAPVGWHVPTDAEWTTLTTYLGGLSIAGGKLKEVGTVNWAINTGATNETDFTALPGGNRLDSGWGYDIPYIGNSASFWTSTLNTTDTAWNRDIEYTDNGMYVFSGAKNAGFSVRCIKD